MDTRSFARRREELAAAYAAIGAVAERLGQAVTQSHLAEDSARLMQETFKVVVVGEFSRGKSTFINALLGARVLPAKTDPTTTMINRITYGDAAAFLLHYRDSDETRTLSQEEFRRITAVEEPLTNDADNLAAHRKETEELARIAFAEIHAPLPVLRGGVELIDTPGTNDLDQVREEITFQFLPEADAAIFLLSAKQILSRSELDFLQGRILANDIQKVFFVVNFKDQLAPEDGARILAYARTELEKIVPHPRLFLVSSKEALNYRRAQNGETVRGAVPPSLESTGFSELEAKLSHYLLEEKSESKLAKYVHRAERAIRVLSDDAIALHERAIGQQSAKLRERIADIRPQIAALRQEAQQALAHAKSRLDGVTARSVREYQRGLEQLARQAASAVHHYEGELDAAAVAAAIESVMAPLQQEHQAHVQQHLREETDATLHALERHLAHLLQDETSLVRGALTLPDASLAPTADALGDLSISTDESDLVGGGLLFGGILLAIHAPFIAIPAAIFGGRYFLQMFDDYRRNDYLTRMGAEIHARYAAIIPEQVERYQAQLARQMGGALDGTRRLLDERFAAMDAQLARLTEERDASEASEAAERQALAALRQRLTETQQQMERLLTAG